MTAADLELKKVKFLRRVLLTGDKKLCNAGLIRKGIRVAVIGSGVDSDHLAFHGRVTKRKGTATGSRC